MDGAIQLLQRRLDEAAVCAHMYSAELLTIAPPELQSQLELGQACAEENLHLVQSTIHIALRFQEGSATADVSAALPPYPSPSQPLQCCVMTSTLSREWVDATNVALAEQARRASVDGTDALAEVLDRLREALAAGSAAAAAAAAAPPPQPARDPGGAMRVALLKLDHMRDRSACIRSWPGRHTARRRQRQPATRPILSPGPFYLTGEATRA